jgi:hypothetical protein
LGQVAAFVNANSVAHIKRGGFAALDAAFAFMDRVGGPGAVMAHNHALALAAGALLSNLWHTETLTCPPAAVGAMCNVRLPTGPAGFVGVFIRYCCWFPSDGPFFSDDPAKVRAATVISPVI